jgi:hypothetical protein
MEQVSFDGWAAVAISDLSPQSGGCANRRYDPNRATSHDEILVLTCCGAFIPTWATIRRLCDEQWPTNRVVRTIGSHIVSYSEAEGALDVWELR